MSLPPLVEPAEKLSKEEIERYSRHLLIPEMGIDGQKRLKNSRVLVIGAGGLGSPALLYLAAAGVGHIGIVEFDRVEESNLQRQVIHSTETIGELKSVSAAQAILNLNPHIHVQLHSERLDRNNVLSIFKQYDLVVDGTDNFATRYLVNDACVLTGLPYVWGSIYRFEGQASVFWENAPNQTGLNYRDLYPEPPPPELAPSCSEGGVLGVLCAAIGSIMATEAIKLITGLGTPLLGKLMVYDALEMSYRSFPLRRDPKRKPITELADYEYFCGLKSNVQPQSDHTPIETLSAAQVKTLLDQIKEEDNILIIDVREQHERDIVKIPGTIHIPKQIILQQGLPDIYKQDTQIILHCKSGVRSEHAGQALKQKGYTNVRHLQGGIMEWVKTIDPSLPQY